MCVIAYASKGIEISEKEFRNCFINNPDGAGFMIYDPQKKKVHIRKGFMDFESFWSAVKDLPTDKDRVFHFRIATSGKVSPECCHPFILTDNLDDMRQTDVYSDIGFSHNGVMADFTPTAALNAPYSDTMHFGAEILYPLRSKLYEESTQYLLKKAMGTNKYAILGKKGAIILGTWNTSKDTGVQYSNTSYKERKKYYDYGSCGNYGYGSYNNSYTYSVDADADVDKLSSKIKTYGGTVSSWYYDTDKIYFTVTKYLYPPHFPEYNLRYVGFGAGYSIPKKEKKVETTYTMIRCSAGNVPMNQEKIEMMMQFVEDCGGSVWDMTENTVSKDIVLYVTNFNELEGVVQGVTYASYGTIKGVYDDETGTVRVSA